MWRQGEPGIEGSWALCGVWGQGASGVGVQGGSLPEPLSGAGWPALGQGWGGVPKVPRACPRPPSLSLCFRATWVSLAQEWPGTPLPSSKPGAGQDPWYPRSHPAGRVEVGCMLRGPHLSVIAAPRPPPVADLVFLCRSDLH